MARHSKCDRCHGTFSSLVDDLAYYRQRNSCETCGAAPCWERAAVKEPRFAQWSAPDEWPEPQGTNRLWIGLGINLPDPAAPQEAWISAQEIPAGDPKPEHSMVVLDLSTVPPLVRTFYIVDALMRGRKTFRDKLVERRLGFVSLLEVELDEERRREFLADGGWFVEKAGTTGLPGGRHARGLRGETLEDELFEIYTSQDYFWFVLYLARQPDGSVPTDEKGVKLNRRQMRRLLEEVIRRVPHANTKALAQHFGITERTVRKVRADVRSANAPKDEGSDIEPQTIHERLEQLEAQLDEVLRQTSEIVQRLRERFPTDAEVSEAVELFLAEAA